MKKVLLIVFGIVLVVTAFALGRFTVENQGVQDIELYHTENIQLLSLSTEENLETPTLERFLELKEALLEAHEVLTLKRETFQESRAVIQNLRFSMRENKLRPSYEDGIRLWTNYHALLNIKDAFDETLGEGYQKLKDLKGSYSIENIDLIIQTYEEVLEVLTIRQGLYDQAIIIMDDSAIVYQTYFNE